MSGGPRSHFLNPAKDPGKEMQFSCCKREPEGARDHRASVSANLEYFLARRAFVFISPPKISGKTEKNLYFFSSGYSAFRQAAQPPFSAETLVNPISIRMPAARALECSSFQVQ